MIFIKVKSSQGCLGKNKGTELAPDLILKEATSANIVEGNLIETNKNLEKTEGDFFIGGDHSITYPLFKSFSKNKNAALIVFDAHPDCTNNFSPPTHEDFIRTLIEEGTLKKENLMLIGLRKIDKIEKEFLDSNKINYILMKDIDSSLPEKIKNFTDNFDSIYLSIDIDVLDPKFAPGTGYQEKDGFSLNQLLEILSKIEKVKRIDLVEVNPLKDKDNITINSARKIITTFK